MTRECERNISDSHLTKSAAENLRVLFTFSPTRQLPGVVMGAQRQGQGGNVEMRYYVAKIADLLQIGIMGYRCTVRSCILLIKPSKGTQMTILRAKIAKFSGEGYIASRPDQGRFPDPIRGEG